MKLNCFLFEMLSNQEMGERRCFLPVNKNDFLFDVKFDIYRKINTRYRNEEKHGSDEFIANYLSQKPNIYVDTSY